jgi:AcrR family transcriptional regulator
MPRRTDALRNREAILRVADEAFTEGTDAVPLDEIARRAGLGRATVYRHFPDRASLAVAVAAQQMVPLKRASAAPAWAACAFRDVLYAVFSTQVSMRALTAAMRELRRPRFDAAAV